MGSQNLQPETTEERLIYWTILMTWVLWLGGLLSLVGAALGYILLMLHGSRVLGLLEDQTRVRPVPMAVLAWVAGMVAMAVALLVAHVDFELGLFQTTKSFLGWMKGWALLAVYPLAGAMMNIRPEIVTRATGKLAAQTLLLTPIFLLAEMTNAAPTLYVSPLHYLLGTGQEFFEVSLYVMDETTGRARFRFFAPWATAAAFVAGLGLILAFHERSKRWFVFGIAATTIVCILSGSRLSVVALPAILLAVLLMSQLSRPATWLMLAGLATIGLLAFDNVVYAYQDATDAFTAARAASSRVRAALGNIAVHRWWTEAPVFGHGALEPGGHVVQRMLIGSHHTWWGLLFVKGAVGFAALAVPLGWSLVELTIKAQRDRVARIGLGIILAILMFSLGDNVEIIAYLIWPSLVFLGIALRRRIFWPYVAYLGSRR